MKGGIADSLNKLNLPIESVDDYPSVLWVMGADENDRDDLTFRDHSHTFFELHIIYEGGVRYGFDDTEIFVTGSEFLLVPPRQLHRVVSCDDSFCKITVAFTLPEKCPLNDRLIQCAPRAFAINDGMRENLDFLMQCTAQRGEFIARIAKMRLAETVYRACEAMDAVSVGVDGRDRYDSRVFRAKKYIDDNPHIFFGCEEVAAFCRVSSKQLGRLFRKSEGIGLLEYIHVKKMEFARQLLADKTLSERSIAQMLGFSGAEYFSRFFKRLEGRLPSEYRKEL